MSTKEKTPNYTPSQVREMVTAYEGGETDNGRKAVVTALAEQMKKSPASIRAKLVNEGVYIKPEKLDKTGNKVEQKGAIVADIAALCGTPEEGFDSLEKTNKVVLQILRKHLTPEPEGETE